MKARGKSGYLYVRPASHVRPLKDNTWPVRVLTFKAITLKMAYSLKTTSWLMLMSHPWPRRQQSINKNFILTTRSSNSVIQHCNARVVQLWRYILTIFRQVSLKKNRCPNNANEQWVNSSNWEQRESSRDQERREKGYTATRRGELQQVCVYMTAPLVMSPSTEEEKYRA